MNENRTKIIAVAVLFVVAGGVLWWQMQPTAEQRAAMETATVPEGQGQADAASDASAGTDQDAGAPAAPSPAIADPASAGAGEAAEGGYGADLDELLARVKEVDFVYDAVAIERNPMRPLAGSTTPRMLMATTGRPGEPPDAQGLALAASRMSVTGIVWDADDPIAVVENEVVHRGYEFATGIVVEDIEPSRVVLRAGDSLVPVDLKER